MSPKDLDAAIERADPDAPITVIVGWRDAPSPTRVYDPNFQDRLAAHKRPFLTRLRHALGSNTTLVNNFETLPAAAVTAAAAAWRRALERSDVWSSDEVELQLDAAVVTPI